MKSLLVGICLLLTIAVTQADFVDAYLEVAKVPYLKCAKTVGYTETDLRVIYDQEEKQGVDKATCLKSCVLKSMNMLKDSKINLDMINEFIKIVHSEEPDKIETMKNNAAECVDQVKDMSDDCKMAFSFIQCYVDKH
ncbi:general odorant-binding protein 19d-like [Bombus pascuorum]|uniref:general odorant-binding protein 19d-like n=1 Tax=Bombus pascuorum TaxID=65598 RepID=UPI002133F6AD|nr:general odorant-binding protein 19d-like [Bombus pascuorum]